MNLLEMSCVITQAYLFLTSMEAVRGQTPQRDRTLCDFNSWFIPQRQFSLQKIHQEMRSVMTLSIHSASISRILEPSPQGLISSLRYVEKKPYRVSLVCVLCPSRILKINDAKYFQSGRFKLCLNFAIFYSYITQHLGEQLNDP